MRTLAALALVSITSLHAAPAARAQEPAPAARPRVVVLDEIVVTPARPAVATFVARARPDTHVEDLRASFTSEIVASTGGAPF